MMLLSHRILDRLGWLPCLCAWWEVSCLAVVICGYFVAPDAGGDTCSCLSLPKRASDAARSKSNNPDTTRCAKRGALRGPPCSRRHAIAGGGVQSPCRQCRCIHLTFTHTTIMDEKVVQDTDAAARAAELQDEAALFASPLPLTGERKTTTRRELWAGDLHFGANRSSLGISTTLATLG